MIQNQYVVRITVTYTVSRDIVVQTLAAQPDFCDPSEEVDTFKIYINVDALPASIEISLIDNSEVVHPGKAMFMTATSTSSSFTGTMIVENVQIAPLRATTGFIIFQKAYAEKDGVKMYPVIGIKHTCVSDAVTLFNNRRLHIHGFYVVRI